MKYRYSQSDKDNSKWFEEDMSQATLSELTLERGTLRGVGPFHMQFTYPISVIAGENRSGKSTILAMVACAFHNASQGFKLSDRRLPYYTFSDFFVQTAEEVPPEGIEIWYRIRHDGWKKSRRTPRGIGNLLQRRQKKKGGKWNNYSARVRRTVIFFGIQRVVPHSEKSVSKNYRSSFADGAPDGWEVNVKNAVGRVLGITYDNFWVKTHGKYHLPMVSIRGNVYSGFNMGAGENALFEIFSTIYASPKGSLLVIDEIELGLHENAQKRLIRELKRISKNRHIQLVCTTHSATILSSVPPEGRFYVESYPGKTVVTPGISPAYAAGKLSGENSNELDIYTEDGVAACIVEAVLSNDIRKRVNVIPIGSAIAIVRQMAARYKDAGKSECVAVMDGDQSSSIQMHEDHFIKALETSKDRRVEAQWFRERLLFLPGKTWPEKWLILSLKAANITGLAEIFRVSEEELSSYIDEAETAGKHNEMYSLAQSLSLDSVYVRCTIAQRVAEDTIDDFYMLMESISRLLP
jgi:energy-coupling factor transporter ATP-binding protein EcfA2